MQNSPGLASWLAMYNTLSIIEGLLNTWYAYQPVFYQTFQKLRKYFDKDVLAEILLK